MGQTEGLGHFQDLRRGTFRGIGPRVLRTPYALDGTLDEDGSPRVSSDLLGRVTDRCLQLHGGYGFINEYPIARLYADNRVNRIYGGTSEVMKLIIAKDMGL